MLDKNTATDHDPAMRATMIRALYGTPGTILFAMLTGTALIAVAAWLTDDPIIAAMAATKLSLTGFRYASHRRFAAKGGRADGPMDELLALAGAWLTAAIIGSFAAYTVHFYKTAPVAMLAVAQAIGYIAGISARNSSRPLITKVQVSIAALPLLGILLAGADIPSLAIAAYVGLIVLVTFSSADVIHRVFVSEFRKTRDLEQLAVSDSLTPLLNRRGFLQDLSRRLQSHERVHLLSIDVDGFKTVNDTFGHDVGDELLQVIASRIGMLLEPGDAAARTGGDEFMVATARSGDDARRLAEALVRLFDEPVKLTKLTLLTSISAGLASATGESVEDALKRCDLAVYKAKQDGKNRWASYSAELSAAYEERVSLERDLRQAVARGDIDLHFQPVYSPKGRTIIFCEALMRWTHPTRGAVSPGVFVAVAEQIGLIKALGTYAIERTIETAAAWPSYIGVSINVSPRQFAQDYDLVEIFRDAIRRHRIDPTRITLEITESTLADDAEFVIASLTEIRAMGVRIALDDFGTGYSSLSYIGSLPIDVIKVDRSFIRDIAGNTRAQALLKAISGVASDLDLKVVVEGVETPEQFLAIERYNVDGVQGFLFARPMPSADVAPLIDQRIVIPAIDRRALTKSLRRDLTAA